MQARGKKPKQHAGVAPTIWAVPARVSKKGRNNGTRSLCQSHAVCAVSLAPQTQGLQTLDQEECSEGVHARAYVPEHLRANLEGVRDGAELVAKDHSMVTFCGLRKPGETARLAPIEFSLVKAM